MPKDDYDRYESMLKQLMSDEDYETAVWVLTSSIEKILNIKFPEPKYKKEWLKEAGLLENINEIYSG